MARLLQARAPKRGKLRVAAWPFQDLRATNAPPFHKNQIRRRHSMSTQKVALVTGAGSGVGRASAVALFKAGYSIVVVGRRADALEQTLQSASANAATGLAVPTDVGKPDEVKALFAKV